MGSIHARTTAAALVIAAASAALAGCGGGGSSNSGNAARFSGAQKDVAKVVDDLQAAARAGDGAKICGEIFSDTLQRSVESASGDCEAAVNKSLHSPKEGFVARTIDITGDRAVAVVDEQLTGRPTTMFFSKQGGQWRIDAVRPRQGTNPLSGKRKGR